MEIINKGDTVIYNKLSGVPETDMTNGKEYIANKTQWGDGGGGSGVNINLYIEVIDDAGDEHELYLSQVTKKENTLEFKIGNKVVLNEFPNMGFNKDLTVGKAYEVTRDTDYSGYVRIMDDSGEHHNILRRHLSLVIEPVSTGPTPRFHVDAIIAWANGYDIEYSDDDGTTWGGATTPNWDPKRLYRKKPEVIVLPNSAKYIEVLDGGCFYVSDEVTLERAIKGLACDSKAIIRVDFDPNTFAVSANVVWKEAA